MVALFGAAGCAYTVPLTPVEIDHVSNRHDTKVPGQFSVQIATEDCCKKEVRSELLMCQAPILHHFACARFGRDGPPKSRKVGLFTISSVSLPSASRVAALTASAIVEEASAQNSTSRPMFACCA